MIDLTDDNEYVEYDKKHGVMTKNSTLLNAGNGLFATKAFKKDEIIIPYDGEKLTLEKKQTRYPNDDAKYLVQLGSNKFIDAVDVSKSNLGRYANHKSLTRANAKLTTHGNIKAKKPIKIGSEIFITYGDSYKL